MPKGQFCQLSNLKLLAETSAVGEAEHD